MIMLVLILALVGCATPSSTTYKIWFDASAQNEELIQAAKERLRKAGIAYKLDKNGSVFIQEKDFQDAVICCS
ncbi:hypothetical protein [Pontibacillus yanchengensis]|nr:hypothetical protein [Pontibacillus yanchengensis]